MNTSAKILVTLATIIAFPLFLAFCIGIGLAVALRFLYAWLEFVWEEM